MPEQVLIDLSWFSSRLEGNRTSLLATRDLFEKGRSENDDRDATTLLNHKETIEFMVDKIVNIHDTVYVPCQVPNLLEEMLGDVV